ncbi:MAG TPA: DUF3078 domain-containing protein [Bacteroidales bacterium]|nr:DUF3078 domain-containing protein [Bacteroidales bacterium]
MKKVFLQFLIALMLFGFGLNALSQEVNDSLKSAGQIMDSLRRIGIIYSDIYKKPEIVLSTEQAVKFLEKKIQPDFWQNSEDPLRKAITQLVFQASNPPYDSSEVFLKIYPYDSLKIAWDKFYIWEPLRFKIPVVAPVRFNVPSDSVIALADTIPATLITDSIVFNLPVLVDSIPFIMKQGGLKDTSILVIIDTLNQVYSSNPSFPFKYLNYPYQSDSIEVAVNSLLKFMEERDSSILNFTGRSNTITPLWLNSKTDNMVRYWLRNEYDDSVTVWIGNIARNTVGLYLEQGINLRRPLKQETGNAEARINVQHQDKSKLLEVQRIVVKQKYWKYRTEANLVFSQTVLSNWVKGGEKSLSSLLDVTGYADYDNKQMKLSSSNFARVKLGFLASGENPIRKNTDIIETNSKLNHKAFGKFDFSAIMLFKTQLLTGYNYPNDSVPVSKFLNPAVLTLGFGLDYKPNKNTSLNFSPLSYKGTYMTDTVNIDQTKYGIAADKKSKHEPGVSVMVTHNWKPKKSLAVTNRLQLFTNYIDNPQNIDIDWEMILTANLNWFTDLRLNTHLIFDDNTRTPVMDENNKPVLNPDGSQKKTARIQFKEMFGISLAFRF